MPTVTITTTRGINPRQLADEIAARMSIPAPYVDRFPDRIDVVGSVAASDEPAIRAALDAHVRDPDYGTPASRREVRAARAKAQAVAAGGDTYTAPQVQRIIAALVLAVTEEG